MCVRKTRSVWSMRARAVPENKAIQGVSEAIHIKHLARIFPIVFSKELYSKI